jgi:hypothetical protein
LCTLKCWLLLPGASEPRLRSLNRRASSFGLSRYIKQREQPEQSYRLQLEISPTRRNHHGQKTNLYTLVDPVSPPLKSIALQSSLVEAPGTAPGSDKLIALAVYHHSHQSCDWGHSFHSRKIRQNKGLPSLHGKVV